MVIVESDDPKADSDSEEPEERPFAERIPFFSPERRRQQRSIQDRLRGRHT